MDKKTKERIDAVRVKSIPFGYVETQAGILPNDWTSKPLSEISEVISEQAGDDDYETLSISAGIGFVNQAQKFGKELSGKQYEKYTVLRKGDFAYNKGNSKRYPQGCTYRLKERDEAAVPNVFECFRITKGCPEYYEQLFISGFMNRQLTRKINHGVRDDGLLNLTDADFYSTVLPIPPIVEQQKIAEVLSTCDSVIELKQELIAEKRKQKKWLMQILSSSSTNVKEIKLSKLCSKIGDGDWIESKDQSESGIRLIQTGNIGVGRYLDKGERAKFISEDTFEKLHCTEVLEGDVLISRLPDPIGRACKIPTLQTKAITAVDCTILRFKDKQVAEFFLQYATSTSYFNHISVLSGGSTRTRVSRKEIENLLIPVPQDAEKMEQIVTGLSVLDKDIDLLLEELETWKHKKKALMQLLLTGTIRVGG